MKRIVLGIALCAGMLFMGVTSASAYCSLDPTLGIEHDDHLRRPHRNPLAVTGGKR